MAPLHDKPSAPPTSHLVPVPGDRRQPAPAPARRDLTLPDPGGPAGGWLRLGVVGASLAAVVGYALFTGDFAGPALLAQPLAEALLRRQ